MRRKRERALLTAIEDTPGISGYRLGIVTRIGPTRLYPDLHRLSQRGEIEWRYTTKPFGGFWPLDAAKPQVTPPATTDDES